MNASLGQEIEMELWDYDPGFPGVQNDDFLGRCGSGGRSISNRQSFKRAPLNIQSLKIREGFVNCCFIYPWPPCTCLLHCRGLAAIFNQFMINMINSWTLWQ